MNLLVANISRCDKWTQHCLHFGILINPEVSEIWRYALCSRLKLLIQAVSYGCSHARRNISHIQGIYYTCPSDKRQSRLTKQIGWAYPLFLFKGCWLVRSFSNPLKTKTNVRFSKMQDFTLEIPYFLKSFLFYCLISPCVKSGTFTKRFTFKSHGQPVHFIPSDAPRKLPRRICWRICWL